MKRLSTVIPALTEGLPFRPARCANPGCATSSALRAVWRRKLGIYISSAWYCGHECFEAAARVQFRDLRMGADVTDQQHEPRFSVGLLLLSRGHIDATQMRIANEEQKRSNAPVAEILVALGFATEEQVTAAIGAQWGYPVMSCTKTTAPVNIPRCIQEFYAMTPLHYVETGKKLLLGFVHRVHHTVLSAVERMTCCTTLPCFITAGEFRRRTIAPNNSARAETEVSFDELNSISEMARITTSYASQLGAESAHFESCGRYLWVRFTQQGGEFDLLFRGSAM